MSLACITLLNMNSPQAGLGYITDPGIKHDILMLNIKLKAGKDAFT